MEVSRTRMKRTADAPVLLQKYKTLAPPRLIYRFLFTVPIYRNQGPYPCDDIMLATEASLLSVSVAIPSATTLITWQWCCIRTDSKEFIPTSLAKVDPFSAGWRSFDPTFISQTPMSSAASNTFKYESRHSISYQGLT